MYNNVKDNPSILRGHDLGFSICGALILSFWGA